MFKGNNKSVQERFLTNTSHVRQRYSWDCGVACVLMVLSEKERSDFIFNFSTICRNEEIDESTWTIDLCYLLRRFNIKHILYTKKIGITSHYGSSIRTTDKDVQRVRKRFKEATSYGLQIIEKTLSTEALMNHVQSRGPAIVLVDARLLACDWCKRNKLTSELRSIWGGSYQGHYITVVGLRGKILYRDPASSHHTCATSPRKLDAARSSSGTDYDVILITK